MSEGIRNKGIGSVSANLKNQSEYKCMEAISVDTNMLLARQRLVELRKENKLTQHRLSDELGFTRSIIAAWETGARKPDMFQLAKISHYYNVTTEYMLGLVESRNDRMRMHMKMPGRR